VSLDGEMRKKFTVFLDPGSTSPSSTTPGETPIAYSAQRPIGKNNKKNKKIKKNKSFFTVSTFL
jgi:hypothetical protein